MNISAREIRIFVGGAFAYIGFRALIGLPFYPRDFVTISATITTGLALPIGISILKGSPRSVLFAQIFLWFVIASSFITVPIYCHAVPAMANRMIQRTIPDLVSSILLLILIYWSRSMRFNVSPAARFEPKAK